MKQSRRETEDLSRSSARPSNPSDVVWACFAVIQDEQLGEKVAQIVWRRVGCLLRWPPGLRV